MAILNAKVTMLNPHNDKNVYKAVYAFIEGRESENTKTAYERAIRDFFWTMRKKKINELVEEDLKFEPMQIDLYRIELKKIYKGKTVNATISALKSLYQKLRTYGFDVDATIFNVESSDSSDSQPYDTLSHEEVIKIVNFVGSKRKGKTKELLVRVAYATAFRQKEILNLKVNDLVQREGQWCLKALGKGNKWDLKKISEDLHEELVAYIKETKKQPTDRLIDIQKSSVTKMMKDIREHFDFGDRHIVFHSFRKASVDEVNVITRGNIKIMQRHANHSSSQTTLDSYTKRAELDDLVVVDINSDVSLERLEQLSHDELINLIKNAERSLQIKLLQQLDK